MKMLIRAIAIAVVMFFIVLGLVVGSRMDQTTIALLGGTTIGLLIATPCAAIITYLALRRQDDGQATTQISPPTYAQNPPQYWVVPQTFVDGQNQARNVLTPTLSQQQTLTVTPFTLPPRRKFYLIGGDGEASEIESTDDDVTA